MRSILCLAALAVPLLAGAAYADDAGEDRLRDALRQAVSEKRAAEDQASAAQAQLAQAQADLAALKAKFDADEAKLGQAQAGGPALKAAQAQLSAAAAQNAALQQSLQKYQGAAQQAQSIAQNSAEEARRTQEGLRANLTALETCKTANKKLIDVAEQVLHLYQDRSFIWVLRKSYEPLIGSARVTLENIVQDYDDKIQAEEYIPKPDTSRR